MPFLVPFIDCQVLQAVQLKLIKPITARRPKMLHSSLKVMVRLLEGPQPYPLGPESCEHLPFVLKGNATVPPSAGCAPAGFSR